MRKILVTIFWVVPLFFIGCSSMRNQPVTSPPNILSFRYLHASSVDGFEEFDFQPDGRLFYYSYTEATSSSDPDVASDYFEPVFSVEKRRWVLDGSGLIIYRGKQKNRLAFKDDGRTVSWNEFTGIKVNRLSFFHALENYTKILRAELISEKLPN